ncbi:MAG: alpha/beta hydrolase [Gammaproteobacteria bacterium]|jgi:pimeloyl-ACP methyl ester carboxylesterase
MVHGKNDPEANSILTFERRGNDANDALVFIHGWPDDQSLWDREFERLSRTHYCVRVTLPNCGKTHDLRWGADFPVLVELISQTVAQALPGHDKVILVGHDWGAYLAYLYERSYPERVMKMITMDVGGHFKPASAGHTVIMTSYQWWLIAAWLIGMIIPYAGNLMTRALTRYVHAPRGADVFSRMNYFYFYLWRAILFPEKFHASLLDRYRPACPILYFYGKNKPFHFHSLKWEKMLRDLPGSAIIAVPHAGHWLMRDQHEAVLARIEQWLR